MELTITEKAADELRKAMDGEAETTVAGLRLGVQQGGCCGAKYSLALAETQDEAVEEAAESQGIKVFVPKEHVPTVTGTVIDYVTTPTGAGFHISQPKAEEAGTGGGCGCGSGHGNGHGHGHGEKSGGCACGSGGSGGCGC